MQPMPASRVTADLTEPCCLPHSLLFPHYIGVCMELQDMHLLDERTPLAGASAGSLIAACFRSGLSLSEGASQEQHWHNSNCTLELLKLIYLWLHDCHITYGMYARLASYTCSTTCCLRADTSWVPHNTTWRCYASCSLQLSTSGWC